MSSSKAIVLHPGPNPFNLPNRVVVRITSSFIDFNLNRSLLFQKIETVVLKVYLPLQSDPNAYAVVPYCKLAASARNLGLPKPTDPLKYFHDDDDTKALASIVELLNLDAVTPLPNFLNSFCHLCDAMDVHMGSLMQNSKEYVPWNELAALPRALELMNDVNQPLALHIEVELSKEIRGSKDFFSCLLDRHVLQRKKEYLEVEYYRTIMEMYLEKEKVASPQRDRTSLLRYWAVIENNAFFEAQNEVGEIIRFILSSPRKQDQGIIKMLQEKWKQISKNTQYCTQVLGSVPAKALEAKKDAISGQLDVCETKIIALNRSSPFKEVSKKKNKKDKETIRDSEIVAVLKNLYEWIQLKSVIRVLSLKSKDREVNIRLIEALGEALKGSMDEVTLGVKSRSSLNALRSKTKLIRDYFEHPEDYFLVVFRGEHLASVESRLFSTIVDLQERLKKRLSRFQTIIQVHPQIETKDSFKALSHTPPVDAAYNREYASDLEVVISDFSERICLRKEKDYENKVKKRLDEGLWVPNKVLVQLGSKKNIDFCTSFPKRSYDALANEMDRFSTQIRNELGENISSSLEKINSSTECRVKWEAMLCRFYRPLDFLGNARSKKIDRIYAYLKEVRGYIAHDLWRECSKPLVNALHIIAHEYPLCRNCLRSADATMSNLLKGIALNYTDKNLKRIMNFVRGSLDFQDYKERTALHFAAERGRLHIARHLIERGANLHICDWRGMTPLHYACEAGQIDLVNLFIDQGAIPESPSDSGSAYQVAIESEQFEVAELLFEQQGDNRQANSLALLNAVLTLNCDRVRLLLDSGHLHPNVRIHGKLPLVELCDLNYVDVTEEGEEIANSLPERRYEIARLLIDSGAMVELQDSEGRCSLHGAATNLLPDDMMNLLLSNASDVSVQDKDGTTPLHCAIQLEGHNWVEALLKKGASVELEEGSIGTPLWKACNQGNLHDDRIVRLLLKYGSNPNEANDLGTALHVAAELGKVKVVRALLRAGASANVVGFNGNYWNKTPAMTARDCCPRYAKEEVLNLINESLSNSS